MPLSHLATISLPLSLITVIGFGLLALVLTRRYNKINQDTEFFLTARTSVPLFKIAWSFFASAVGSWVVFSLPSYTVDPTYGAGYLGLVFYSFFVGSPLILVASAGIAIRRRYPDIMSWGDFAGRRFGRPVEIYVTLMVLLVMSINLVAEYTAIGLLFEHKLGINAVVPILVVGAVTMIYTVLGGLYISILTDRWQGMFTMLLVGITVIYVAATFRPGPLPELSPILGNNEAGRASIVTMGVSMISASFFSDAIWQRVWASESEFSLKMGAFLGGCLATLVAFWFGFGGFLAAWAGYMGDDSTLAFFDLLSLGNTESASWIVVITILIAVTLNESAVDSFQNALTDSSMSFLIGCGFKPHINWARALTIAINVPLVVVGLQGYNINQLYLIGNMMTTLSILPLLSGLIPQLESFVSGFAVLFGSLFAFFSVGVYGYIKLDDFGLGLRTYFYLIYDWPPFIIGLVASVVGMLLFAVAETAVRKLIHRPLTLPERSQNLTDRSLQPTNSHEVQHVGTDVKQQRQTDTADSTATL